MATADLDARSLPSDSQRVGVVEVVEGEFAPTGSGEREIVPEF